MRNHIDRDSSGGRFSTGIFNRVNDGVLPMKIGIGQVTQLTVFIDGNRAVFCHGFTDCERITVGIGVVLENIDLHWVIFESESMIGVSNGWTLINTTDSKFNRTYHCFAIQSDGSVADLIASRFTIAEILITLAWIIEDITVFTNRYSRTIFQVNFFPGTDGNTVDRE